MKTKSPTPRVPLAVKPKLMWEAHTEFCHTHAMAKAWIKLYGCGEITPVLVIPLTVESYEAMHDTVADALLNLDVSESLVLMEDYTRDDYYQAATTALRSPSRPTKRKKL